MKIFIELIMKIYVLFLSDRIFSVFMEYMLYIMEKKSVIIIVIIIIETKCHLWRGKYLNNNNKN